MEKNNPCGEFEFRSGSLNGFLMIAIDICLWALTVFVLIVAVAQSPGSLDWLFGVFAVLLVASIVFSCGFTMLEPNEAKVMTFFGRYVGTFRKTGFYWLNPFMGSKNVSLRVRNLNAEPIKVNDKMGNPVLIGLVVVWRLKDTYKAIFDIDTDISSSGTVGAAASVRMNKFERFVAIQSDSALREVAGMYAYDNANDANEVTLRDSSAEINEVLEARINYLAYAPEIAAVMLRRQQAAAIITAREKIVEGAVSMVRMALDKLSDENVVRLDEDRKAQMVSNLLVVLCADEPAQPVINSSSVN